MISLDFAPCENLLPDTTSCRYPTLVLRVIARPKTLRGSRVLRSLQTKATAKAGQRRGMQQERSLKRHRSPRK